MCQYCTRKLHDFDLSLKNPEIWCSWPWKDRENLYESVLDINNYIFTAALGHHKLFAVSSLLLLHANHVSLPSMCIVLRLSEVGTGSELR